MAARGPRSRAIVLAGRVIVPVACALLLAAYGAGAALAAPWPSLTPVAGPSAHASRLPPGAPRAPAGFDPVRWCGSTPDALAERMRDHDAHIEQVPLGTPHTRDIGEIAVLEDDGNFFYTHNTGNPAVDLMAVSRAFYRTHDDDYDQIAVFLASGLTDWLGSPTSFAAAFVVKNDTRGLGMSLVDESAMFGAAQGRLQSILSMNGLHRWLDDPLAINHTLTLDLSGVATLGHEFEHRWGAYVWLDSLGNTVPALLGRGHSHWGFFFDSDASVLEGCDWAPAAVDSFQTVGNGLRYGKLDQYLMGLRSAAEVGPLLKIDAPTQIAPAGFYSPGASPATGVTCVGSATTWQITDVITANGPRVPDAETAPRTQRLAIVLAVPRGSEPSTSDLARLDSLRVHFETWHAWATEGRGLVDTHLTRRAGSVIIQSSRLCDSEDTMSPRALGARVSVVGGNMGRVIVPASVRVRIRSAGPDAFATLPMSPVAPDSFAAMIPPGAGTFEYYLEAASDSIGIAAVDPPLGAAAPETFRNGPDLTPPLVLHARVPMQALFRLPQKLLARVTDNLGVDSVWAEASVDGGPLSSYPTVHAGPDSFRVALGGTLAPGQRMAYRFVARDGSAAHNVGFSNPAFDTLLVERDYWEDFENGEALLHDSPIYSYRDLWHAAADPSAPSRGVGMLCGNEDGAYPPHLDAALYSPWLYGIPAGARLQFDHRYDLEQADSNTGWDGAILEGQANGGAWVQLTPQSGYPMTLASAVSTVPRGTPCWSGDSHGWRTDFADLAILGSGPAILRFRMVTDDFIGREGWRIDHVRLIWSNGITDVPIAAGNGRSGVWPNPAAGSLRLALPDGARGAITWELFDLAGRRVATLWKGERAGGGVLTGALPPGVPPGLYFSRLTRDGRELSRSRVAIVR